MLIKNIFLVDEISFPIAYITKSAKSVKVSAS